MPAIWLGNKETSGTQKNIPMFSAKRLISVTFFERKKKMNDDDDDDDDSSYKNCCNTDLAKGKARG